MALPHEQNPNQEVLVFDIERSQTKKMPKSELDAKVALDPKNVQSIKIPVRKSQVPIWLGDVSMDPKQQREQWFASVYIPPSIRFQRFFGRWDTLYVTGF